MVNRLRVVTATYLALHLFITASDAQEVVPSPTHPVVVFRFDGQLFREAVDRSVERSLPIRSCVLDAWCVGRGDVTGTVSLDFAAGTLERIPIKLVGRVDVAANGYTGPLISTARTQIEFEGELAIGFDGDKYFPLPSSVNTHSRTTVDRMRTKRQRLGSRVISRIAQRIAPTQVRKYDAETERLAERDIIEAADEALDETVLELNKLFDIEKTLIALAASQGYERRLSKTDRYLQIQVSPIGSVGPGSTELLPPESEMSPRAEIEVWVYPNVDRPPVTQIAMFWQQVSRSLRGVVEIPERIQSLENQVSISEVGPWDVIRIRRP